MTDFIKAFGDCLGPLNFPMKDNEARELEKLMDTGDYEPFKLEKATATESFAPGERADVSIISDNSVDSEGDVIDTAVIDFIRFQKNPVVSWFHNYKVPPVARSLWQKNVGNLWKAKTQYLTKPDNLSSDDTWLPDTLWGLVKSNVLRGKSLGGVVHWRSPTQDDFDKNPKWEGAKRIAKSAIIFEYAICPKGVNKNAIVESIAKAEISFPIEILEKDFPEAIEVLEQIRKAQEEKNKELAKCRITNFITLEAYKKQQSEEFDTKVQEIMAKAPDVADAALKRIIGIL